MNPRYRRLLIPGLLIALLVIVLVSSLARKADGAEARPAELSSLTDPRITESSGLVMSREDDDLAYTINDSGSDPVVYAVDITTGDTVGTATLPGDLSDTEALSIDGDGTLWVADTGDNERDRTDVALYSLPEFGRSDRGTVEAARYPLTYPDGPRDVEALAVNPLTGEKFLLSKGLLGGEVYSVPDDLVADEPNEVAVLDPSVPGVITDAAFTVDGRYVIARDYSSAHVLDATTWQSVSSTRMPSVDQGETLATEASGRSYLVGSEGVGSALIRIPFTAPPPPEPSDEPSPSPSPTVAAVDPSTSPPAGGNGFPGATWFWAVVVVGLLAAISAAATTRRH
ncbi:MAG: hypothetical protein ABWX74_08440 [Aeromicrobium sp.]